MFTQQAAAPTSAGLASPVSASATATSPTSRPSRLRGLSYLRNYTHTHLLSRDSAHANHHQHHHAAASSPNTGSNSPTVRPSAQLERSLSFSPTGLISPNSATSTPTDTLSANPGPAATGPAATPTPLPTNCPSLAPATNHPLGPGATAATSILAVTTSSTTREPQTSNTTLTTAPQPPSSSPSTTNTIPPQLPSSLQQLPSSTAPTTAAIVPAVTDTAVAALAADPDPGAIESSLDAAAMTRTRAATTTDTGSGGQNTPGPDILPSIRFSTFYDPRSTRPSLTFSTVSRTLPSGTEIIRVGRYSERDSQPPVPMNVPSAAPVGFKSKVVSRRHCEFWYEAGKWYIKDVKSSSGTFLNHIRLSPPGTESKPFPINDGDIVQLGIDFKGGEEMIFRCVKMRLELNRGWQNKLNSFNLATHKRLRNMTQSNASNSSAKSYSQDCSICLNSIAPCQCLFVAPCSHTWHYKCIRSLLASPQYPIFICPNCRAAADLEAEVEDPEEWEQVESESENGKSKDEDAMSAIDEGAQTMNPPPTATTAAPPMAVSSSGSSPASDGPADVTMQVNTVPITHSANAPSRADVPSLSHATSPPVPIRNPSTAAAAAAAARLSTAAGAGGSATPNGETNTLRPNRTPSPNGPSAALLASAEGPITPRNDAGPWVFDGSGVRLRAGNGNSVTAGGGVPMNSLDAAATEMQIDG